MNRKQQGDLGVASAIWHYTKLGYVVSLPTTDNARYDLVVDIDGQLNRVQCKTTGYKSPHGVYTVQLSTQGGNQTWNGVKKFITAEECELVWVYCLDETRYEIPVERVAGKAALNLGKLCESYKIIA